MLRGSQKQMIVVRTKDSRMFEEAYFVMRRGVSQREADAPDMLWEANRIIESSLPSAECGGAVEGKREIEGASRASKQSVYKAPTEVEPRFNLVAGLVWFGMGFLIGGGLVGLLWLIL